MEPTNVEDSLLDPVTRVLLALVDVAEQNGARNVTYTWRQSAESGAFDLLVRNPGMQDFVSVIRLRGQLIAALEQLGLLEQLGKHEVFLNAAAFEKARVIRKHQKWLRILRIIDALKESSSRFVADHEIAPNLQLAVQAVEDHLSQMEEKGLVVLSRTFAGCAANLTPEGRDLLRNPGSWLAVDDARPSAIQIGELTMGDTFNMAGDFRGTIINIKSSLTNASLAVGAISGSDETLKDELRRLIEQLKNVLEQAPSEKAEEAEAVAESAEALVEAATREMPNKTMVRISAEGLKKAAENLANIMPAVLTIATQIVEIISKVTGA